jgi:hypothetical protein
MGLGEMLVSWGSIVSLLSDKFDTQFTFLFEVVTVIRPCARLAVKEIPQCSINSQFGSWERM